MSDKIVRYPFLSKSSFIGGWILPEKITNKLIDVFNLNADQLKPGGSSSDNEKLGIAVNKKIKDSLDIGVDPFYFEPPFDEYRNYLQLFLEDYIKVFKYAGQTKKFKILESYNFQYYKPNGGYFSWHTENDLGPLSAHRHLVFMTYLNDVPDGGTEFYYQKMITPAKKGLTLIWPTAWTHTHKGQISTTREKVIITGWYNGTELYNQTMKENNE